MFSISDIKALHRLCLSDSSLPKPPKCLELVSGDGLILESAAKAAIEAIILRPKNCESMFPEVREACWMY